MSKQSETKAHPHAEEYAGVDLSEEVPVGRQNKGITRHEASLSDYSLSAPVSREEFEGLKARVDRMQARLDRASSIPGLEALREAF